MSCCLFRKTPQEARTEHAGMPTGNVVVEAFLGKKQQQQHQARQGGTGRSLSETSGTQSQHCVESDGSSPGETLKGTLSSEV